jgi:hypothetical protein
VEHSKGHAKGKVYVSKNNLQVHLKLLEKQEQTKTKTSRWKEIKKVRDGINEIESRKTVPKINKPKN